MDNLINETNQRLHDIIDNLTTIKSEYENKLNSSNNEIEIELGKVKKYKDDFFISKQKIEKMNSDIEGFEEDYQNLVDRFKDDELANILIAANKEISAKIDERKRKIAKDKVAMNDLVEKAELSKNKLVKLTAEKRALELCLAKILDAHEFYTKALTQVINYSNDNSDNLSSCFHEEGEVKLNFTKLDDIVNEYNKKDEANEFEEEYIIEEDNDKDELDNVEDIIEEENIEEESIDESVENDINEMQESISDEISEIDLDDEELNKEEKIDFEDTTEEDIIDIDYSIDEPVKEEKKENNNKSKNKKKKKENKQEKKEDTTEFTDDSTMKVEEINLEEDLNLEDTVSFDDSLE